MSLLLLVVLLTASSCAGQEFFVGGGRDGWTTHPGEAYDHYKVNDVLVFFNTHEHAVLWVSQRSYTACNTTQPYQRLDGGESRFVLNNIDYHYFISADAGRCRAGERLVVFAASNDAATTSPVLPPPAPPPPPPSSSSSLAPPPSPSPAPVPGTNDTSPPSPWFVVVGAAILYFVLLLIYIYSHLCSY